MAWICIVGEVEQGVVDVGLSRARQMMAGNDLPVSGVLNVSNFWLRGNSAPGPFPFLKPARHPRATLLFWWFEAAQISIGLFRFKRIGTVTIKALIDALAFAAGRQRQIHFAPAF